MPLIPEAGSTIVRGTERATCHSGNTVLPSRQPCHRTCGQVWSAATSTTTWCPDVLSLDRYNLTILHKMAPMWPVILLGLVASLANADGLYTKDSPVLQVTGKTYNSLIAQSNYTSVSLHPLTEFPC
jgi:hypothetical protein